LRWESARGFTITGYNVGGYKVRRDRGYEMLAALEINFALWGMIGCAMMETAQFFDFFL
jgi:hypothetical protein